MAIGVRASFETAGLVTFFQVVALGLFVLMLRQAWIRDHVPFWSLSLVMMVLAFLLSVVLPMFRDKGQRKVAKGVVDLSLTVWAMLIALSLTPNEAVPGLDIKTELQTGHATLSAYIILLVLVALGMKAGILVLDLIQDWSAASTDSRHTQAGVGI